MKISKYWSLSRGLRVYNFSAQIPPLYYYSQTQSETRDNKETAVERVESNLATICLYYKIQVEILQQIIFTIGSYARLRAAKDGSREREQITGFVSDPAHHFVAPRKFRDEVSGITKHSQDGIIGLHHEAAASLYYFAGHSRGPHAICGECAN